MWPYIQSKFSLFAHGIARRLQQYLNRLPKRTLWIVMLVFFLTISSLLVTVLIRSWHAVSFLSVQTVHIPAVVTTPMPLSTESLRQQAVLKHLQHAVYQIDSLRTNPATKDQYDSLMLKRPGLLDSLLQAQQLFLHPLTNTP
jgi:hypothetical protein